MLLDNDRQPNGRKLLCNLAVETIQFYSSFLYRHAQSAQTVNVCVQLQEIPVNQSRSAHVFFIQTRSCNTLRPTRYNRLCGSRRLSLPPRTDDYLHRLVTFAHIFENIIYNTLLLVRADIHAEGSGVARSEPEVAHRK